MRYRIESYIIAKTSSVLQIGILVPAEVFSKLTTDEETGYLDAASQKYVTESVRLIADETQGGYVVMSTGQKGVVDYMYPVQNTNNAIALYIPIASLITAADGDADDLAAINAMANTDQFTIEMDWGDEPTGLSGGDDAHNLASFFNITEATEYTALTPAEAIAIARDCQYNVMGTDWPIPTWLPTGVTEAQVESAAEGLGIPYHEPTQTA